MLVKDEKEFHFYRRWVIGWSRALIYVDLQQPERIARIARQVRQVLWTLGRTNFRTEELSPSKLFSSKVFFQRTAGKKRFSNYSAKSASMNSNFERDRSRRSTANSENARNKSLPLFQQNFKSSILSLISNEEARIVKARRRTLKNRIYAHNCRIKTGIITLF